MDLYISRSKAIQKFRQIAERNTKLAESTNSDFYVINLTTHILIPPRKVLFQQILQHEHV